MARTTRLGGARLSSGRAGGSGDAGLSSARVSGSGDTGQIVPLVIGYLLILAALVTVVADASAVFLARRALAAAADAAALVAAQQVDVAALVDGQVETAQTLVLDPRAASGAVSAYVVDAALGERFPGLSVLAVELSGDATTVSVTLGARVRLPLVGSVATGWAEGVPITATARARAPLRR